MFAPGRRKNTFTRQNEIRHDLHRRRRAKLQARRRGLVSLLLGLRQNRKVASPVVSAETTSRDERNSIRQSAWRRGLLLGVRFLCAWALTASLVFGVYGIYRFLHESQHFAIKKVVITPTVHVGRDLLLERAGLLEPERQNLFQLDLRKVQRDLKVEPWLKSVRVRRVLPSTLVIEVIEQKALALLAMEALYLINKEGEAFKRATPAEVHGLTVITGVTRETYTTDPKEGQGQVQQALRGLSFYQKGGLRPEIGEVHIDPFVGLTFYTNKGVAVRLGQGGPSQWEERLQRFDAVWVALQREGQKPAVILLDNHAHPDHVTVRLEQNI